MGQLALGVRSLIIRLVIFFFMAVLLAWALGGTLWPRPVSAPAISATNGAVSCTWVARVSSYDPSMPLTYSLKWVKGGKSTTYRRDWTEVCGFVFDGDAIWTAARHEEDGWQVLELAASDGEMSGTTSVQSRLEADEMLLEKRP